MGEIGYPVGSGLAGLQRSHGGCYQARDIRLVISETFDGIFAGLLTLRFRGSKVSWELVQSAAWKVLRDFLCENLSLQCNFGLSSMSIEVSSLSWQGFQSAKRCLGPPHIPSKPQVLSPIQRYEPYTLQRSCYNTTYLSESCCFCSSGRTLAPSTRPQKKDSAKRNDAQKLQFLQMWFLSESMQFQLASLRGGWAVWPILLQFGPGTQEI